MDNAPLAELEGANDDPGELARTARGQTADAGARDIDQSFTAPPAGPGGYFDPAKLVAYRNQRLELVAGFDYGPLAPAVERVRTLRAEWTDAYRAMRRAAAAVAAADQQDRDEAVERAATGTPATATGHHGQAARTGAVSADLEAAVALRRITDAEKQLSVDLDGAAVDLRERVQADITERRRQLRADAERLTGDMATIAETERALGEYERAYVATKIDPAGEVDERPDGADGHWVPPIGAMHGRRHRDILEAGRDIYRRGHAVPNRAVDTIVAWADRAPEPTRLYVAPNGAVELRDRITEPTADEPDPTPPRRRGGRPSAA